MTVGRLAVSDIVGVKSLGSSNLRQAHEVERPYGQRQVIAPKQGWHTGENTHHTITP